MSDTMQDFTRKSLHMVDPEDSVMDVYNALKRNKVRHLPVVSNGEAVGIISDRDVQFINVTGDSFDMKAKDIMTREPYSVDAMTSVPHVVNTMAQRKINSVLIHDSNEKVVGIFTSTDALQILSASYQKRLKPRQAH